MKTISSNTLLEQLQEDTRKLIYTAKQLDYCTPEMLEHKPATGGWSVAQVLEHLNIYARYYLDAIEQKLHRNTTKPTHHFSPGWLGNYFTKLMLPTANKTIAKKMKAPKNAVPAEHPDGKAMLHEFIQHQHRLLNLLQVAKTANIGKLRIATSLSKLITLKLGDTFRFFIAHQQRHFLQVKRILAAFRKQNTCSSAVS